MARYADDIGLSDLVIRRLGDQWEAARGEDTTHQIELVSGRIVEYHDGDEPPPDFDRDTQLWMRVRRKPHA